MGKKKIQQLTIAAAILLTTIFFVYQKDDTIAVTKQYNLKEIFGPLPGYVHKQIPLSEDNITFLKLDDYTQVKYHKAQEPITLYIGYYYDLEKISAAHSPLVCFPGQGWKISSPVNKQIKVGEHTINYAEMIATTGGHRELVLFWYQAYDKTVTQIFKNKVNAVFNKIAGKKPEHAFVRVSISINTLPEDQGRTLSKEFITEFYPRLIQFIKS